MSHLNFYIFEKALFEIIMQKHISFVEILKEINAIYAPLWTNLLSQIRPSAPILSLQPFGAIAFIENSLYLIIADHQLNGFKAIKPMIILEQYFLKPNCYRLNFRDLTKLQRYVGKFFIDYLKRIIPLHGKSIYRHVIDFNLLGQLTITKSTISYDNGGQNQWKYERRVQRIELPRLLTQQSNENQGSIQKMARTLSLNIKKQPRSEEKVNKVSLRRSISMSRIQTSMQPLKPSISHEQKPLLKDLYQKNKRTKSKLTLDRPATETLQQVSNKKHNIEQRQRIVTTGFKIKTEQTFSRSSFVNEKSKSRSKLNSQQKLNTKYDEQSFKSKNSRIKLPAQKNRLTLLRQTKQTFVPRQRGKMLKIQNIQQKIKQRNVYEFIQRRTAGCLKKPEFKNVQQKKIQQYFAQICKIYLAKQLQVRKQRQDKVLLRKAQNKRYKKFSKIQLNKTYNIIKFITPFEQFIFNEYFKLVQNYKSEFKKLTLEYYIIYAKHYQLMKQCVSSLRKLNSKVVVSQQLKIQIALLLNNFYQCVNKIQRQLLDDIIIRKEKFISISICSETSFLDDIGKICTTFQSIFEPLISQINSIYSPILHLQPHQTSSIQLYKQKLLELMSNCQLVFQQNLSKFKTIDNKNLISILYHTEKQGIALISKVYQLREQLDSQIDFKGQIAIDGVSLNMIKIKQYYLSQLDHKLFELYQFLKRIYEKSESELNMRLKTIISINVDYLNDYKCREYKQSIEENYKNLVECIMMIINELRPLSKGLQMKHYLGIAFSFKQHIQQNFRTFDVKVLEYRNISIKTIRLLQANSKSNKQILRQLTQRLKHILQSLINQRSILQNKSDILTLEEQYNTYCINNANLITIMKQNDMVYWQDDSFFPTHLQLLKSSLQFLESRNYKILFNTPLTELTFEQFSCAYQQFKAFMTNFYENRLEKLFRPAYTLLQENISLVEIALYKEYTQFELQRAKEIGIDLEAEKNSKVFGMVKRYQALDKKRHEKLLELYQQSRLNEFQLHQDTTCNRIEVQKHQGEFNTLYISNMEELKSELSIQKNILSHERLAHLQEIASLYDQVLLFHRIINLISNYNMNHENKEVMQQEINLDYSKLLNLNVEKTAINGFKIKLFTYKFKYMDILYIQKINVLPQYCLVDIRKLIELSNWQTADRINKNVQYLFEEIDEVQIVNEGSISCLVLGKDKIHLQKGINVWLKQGDKSKQVYMHIQNFMRQSVNHSEFTCTSIKILIWSIYFTQQVELNLMTNVPLIQLKTHILQLITEIASQVRYDTKMHHMSFEITQLQAFVNHLQKIINLQAITDYEWVTTIRFYERLKVIKIEQNDRVYQYGFQPKKPMNFDPNFQLQTSISYGLPECSTYYQVSSFILGQPYRTFNRLSDYGFQKNYLNLMTIIKKYRFYIRIIVDTINFKKINYLHKNILEFSLKKMKGNEQQTLGLPIFFQYKNEQYIPTCFPQKIKKFSTPQFIYNLNLVVLLRLNKCQQMLDGLGINVEIICKALSYISNHKKLSLKKTIQFMDNLQKYLDEGPKMQDIYKFCFKYFLVNFQIEDNQLSIILQNLMIKKEQATLQSQSNRILQLLHAFKDQNEFTKHHLIVYGDTSTKTYSIQKAGISYYKKQQTINGLVHIEGISQFIAIKASNNKLVSRFVIEDRYIWNIDPANLTDHALHYVNELGGESVESIFKEKIAQMEMEGNYKRLWMIVSNLHEIYCNLQTGPSFLGMVSLILRVFSKNIHQFVSHLQPQIRKDYKVGINKDIITSFLVIVHEMYFYLLPSKLRKQFSEKVRQLPSLQDHRSEDLPTLTCNGTSCQKLLSLIKKQKKIHSNIGNYLKQFIILKKYLKYNQSVVIQYSNCVMLNAIKDYFNDLDQDIISLTTQAKHMSIIQKIRYKKILYVVDELHLADKKQITFLKTYQEHYQNQNIKYILMSRDRSYTKVMSTHATFKYQEMQIDEIYKYQTKSGINDLIQQRSKLLFGKGYFRDEMEYLSFLINITIKLPSQYYNKYYARMLIFVKLSLQKLAITQIFETEKYLKEMISINSENAYLSDCKGSHQQMNQLQINTRIDKVLQKFSFMERAIIKDHSKKMLPYLMADRIYIVKEDVYLLPVLVSTIHDRKHYQFCNKATFVSQLLQIVEENYKQLGEFTVVFKQPLSTSPQCYYFLSHYLKGLDIISLYDEFLQFAEMLTKKQEFVYRLTSQQIVVMKKINNILYNNMKLIICLTNISEFPEQICQSYSHKIICLNSQLSEQSRVRVASTIFTKIISQQTQFCQEILKQRQSMIISLVKHNLIDLNRFESFLRVSIDHINEESTQIKKNQESRTQKRNLLSQLIKIKTSLEESLQLEQAKLQIYNQLLSDIMAKIDTHKKQDEEPIIWQHKQSLIKLRNVFMSNDQQLFLQLDSNLKYQSFYHLLQKTYFQQQLTLREKYPILNINSSRFLQLREKEQMRAILSKIGERDKEQLNNFILYRYLKYMLKILEQYDSIMPSAQMVGYQISEINYFYLIDVAIDLKKKCQIIAEQHCKKKSQHKMFESIISALIELEHLNLGDKLIQNYFLLTRVSRVIKNNAIQIKSFPVKNILQTENQQFSKIRSEFDEHVLKQSQPNFQQFCKNLLKQDTNLIIYDPYWRIQSFCASINIDVIYVSGDSDLKQVYDYKFTTTIFCILLPTINSYYENRQLINTCQDIISKKHNDLSKNTLEKLALWIKDKRLLTEIDYVYPIINLDYTLSKFDHFVSQKILNDKFRWSVVKKQYSLVKEKLIKEIELIKTLSNEEILLYIIKIQQLVANYQVQRQYARSISEAQIIKPEWHAYIQQIYSVTIKLHLKLDLHFNLSMRLLKKVNFKDLLIKWGLIISRSPEQKLQFMKEYILSVKSDKIMNELQQCIQQSRYVVVIYTHFNNKIVKEMLELEDSGRYQIRIILEIDQTEIRQFMEKSAFGISANQSEVKQVVLFFVQSTEIIKLDQILPKCSVLRI